MAKSKQKTLTRLVATELGLRIPDFKTGKKVDAIPVGGPVIIHYGQGSVMSRAPKQANAYINGEELGRYFTVQYYRIFKILD